MTKSFTWNVFQWMLGRPLWGIKDTRQLHTARGQWIVLCGVHREGEWLLTSWPGINLDRQAEGGVKSGPVLFNGYIGVETLAFRLTASVTRPKTWETRRKTARSIHCAIGMYVTIPRLLWGLMHEEKSRVAGNQFQSATRNEKFVGAMPGSCSTLRSSVDLKLQF